MNLSVQDIEDNFWFYQKNCDKLIKINDIINNIKTSNFKNLSPQEVLAKIVPENELKNIDSNKEPDNNSEKKENNDSNKDPDNNEEEKKKIDEKTPINPEYVVPSKWENLFRLEISDKALDKLYIESKILFLATEFSYWKNENIEQWLLKINKDNYQKYEEEFEKQKNDERSSYNKIKKVLKEIISLEHFKKAEEEIRNNIDYYYNNINLFIKIDNIIENAIIGDIYDLTPGEAYNIYDLTPGEAYKKVTGDNPNHLNLPDKWEDLFNLGVKEWAIDILLATTKNNIKNKEFEANRIESNREFEGYYKTYKKNEINESNNQVMDKKTLLKEIKQLKYFKVKESEIKKNVGYYSKNFEILKKINTMIENAKKAKIYNISPGDFMKKETGMEYSFPNKWEDLFKLEGENWKIDILFDTIVEKIEKSNKRKYI